MVMSSTNGRLPSPKIPLTLNHPALYQTDSATIEKRHPYSRLHLSLNVCVEELDHFGIGFNPVFAF